MIAILIKTKKQDIFCEDRDYGRNPLYTSSPHFRSGSLFLKAITVGYLCFLLVTGASTLDTLAHVVGLKKEVVVAN